MYSKHTVNGNCGYYHLMGNIDQKRNLMIVGWNYIRVTEKDIICMWLGGWPSYNSNFACTSG